MAVVVDELGKSYRENRALDGVSLTLRTGEILCVCGPNGAGKTTLLEIMQGSRRADSGEVRILGRPVPLPARLRAKVGVLFQDAGAPPRSRVGELVGLLASFYPAPEAVGEVLASVGLAGFEDREFRALSGGQQRRVLMAAALVGRPQVLLLDEPTSGLDPQGREILWTALRARAAEGTAVLVTTHHLEEAEDYCDRVVLLSKGRILVDGPPRSVVASQGLVMCCLVPDALEAACRDLHAFGAARASRTGGGRLAVFFDEDPCLDAFVDEVRVEFGSRVDMAMRPARLEDLLLLAGDGTPAEVTAP